MELDGIISRVKQLIAQRETIDAELSMIFAGSVSQKRKAPVCSVCGQEGHRANACPNKPTE